MSQTQVGGTIFNRRAQILGFDDDLDIVERNLTAVEEAFLNLYREVAKVGLVINEEKYMKTDPQGKRKPLPVTKIEDVFFSGLRSLCTLEHK